MVWKNVPEKNDVMRQGRWKNAKNMIAPLSLFLHCCFIRAWGGVAFSSLCSSRRFIYLSHCDGAAGSRGKKMKASEWRRCGNRPAGPTNVAPSYSIRSAVLLASFPVLLVDLLSIHPPMALQWKENGNAIRGVVVFSNGNFRRSGFVSKLVKFPVNLIP